MDIGNEMVNRINKWLREWWMWWEWENWTTEQKLYGFHQLVTWWQINLSVKCVEYMQNCIEMRARMVEMWWNRKREEWFIANFRIDRTLMRLRQVKIEIGRNEKRIKKFSMRSQFSGSEKKIQFFSSFSIVIRLKCPTAVAPNERINMGNEKNFTRFIFWEANDH